MIAPFHDLATGRSSVLARLVLTVLRREGFEVFTLEKEDATREKLDAFLDERIRKGEPLNLLIYAGHGLSHCLQGQENASNAPLLDEENIGKLAGSTIISISCRSAKELGRDSIKKGVRSFIGWNHDLYLPEIMENSRNFQADFIRTLLLLPLLMSKGHSVKYTIGEYKKLANSYVDKYQQEKYLFAEDAGAWLRSNIAGITFLGPSDTTVEPQFVF